MKKFCILLLLVFGVQFAQSQELVWHTNVKEAIKISEKKKKPMLLFFTGSDWCGWCIRLQKEVLKTDTFAKWAKENVVLVELDYPRAIEQTPELKAQNSNLQMAFSIQGFPTIHFANAVKAADGKVNFQGLGSTGYVAGGPEAWLAVATKILDKKKR
ncbi:thioredoxin family protein [Flavobacterium crassostreae]|uniref:Thioredoxin n=1 Tax=Flavobacterium crassostreae TaxID=1763534 RepID=A0A1B9DZS6_9FLAO|nr:thioredoxin family protein [Flavobacterium crassostreae]OCB75205.1 thioredoxin [Flavobacterium crassostreae]